jgi:hypothetical protein
MKDIPLRDFFNTHKTLALIDSSEGRRQSSPFSVPFSEFLVLTSRFQNAL